MYCARNNNNDDDKRVEEMCIHWVRQGETDPFLEAAYLGDGGGGEGGDLELGNEASKRRK